MAGRVRVTHRINQWREGTERKLDAAVLTMATDIQRVATTLAPVETGNLASSGRIEREGEAHYTVIFGGNRVPYARRRHYENKKNPGTLKYLERAGDSTARNIKRYLKGI